MNRDRQFLPALTAMRGLAAWWVVLYHFRDEVPHGMFGSLLYPIFSQGHLAVDFFFILSGFILSLTYGNTPSKFGSVAYKKFLRARIARIYPLHLFILMIFVVNPVAIAFFSSANKIDSRYNITYFFLSIPLFQNWGFTNTLGWNIPAWSISTEWAAYILFPLYTWFGQRLGSTIARNILLIAGLLALLAVLCYVGGHSLGGNIPRFGLVRCLLEFGAGVALHRAWRDWQSKNHWHARFAFLLALGLVALYVWGRCPDFVVMPFTFALIIFSGATDAVFFQKLSCRFMIMLGEISYSTYLIHYFVKDWIKFSIIHTTKPSALYLFAYLLSVFVASIFLYKCVEIPTRRWLRPETSTEDSSLQPFQGIIG